MLFITLEIISLKKIPNSELSGELRLLLLGQIQEGLQDTSIEKARAHRAPAAHPRWQRLGGLSWAELPTGVRSSLWSTWGLMPPELGAWPGWHPLPVGREPRGHRWEASPPPHPSSPLPSHNSTCSDTSFSVCRKVQGWGEASLWCTNAGDPFIND